MLNEAHPTSHKEVLEIVRWANSEQQPLHLFSHKTKETLGGLVKAENSICLTSVSGIELYEPDELVITVKAGTPVSEIESALAENNQHLSFEPPDFGQLLTGISASGTVGGLISCNLSGPRRIKDGAVRDHFLGFCGVSGRGEEFKSGGKVVKNVTGFDLSKLIAGSYGTLGILTEVTLRALPKPKKTRTVLIHWPKVANIDFNGIQSMTDALCSSNEVSGAAFLPCNVAKRSKIDLVSSFGGSVTAIRIEGSSLSVKHRCNALKSLLEKYGKMEELHTKKSSTLWKEIRDIKLLPKNQKDMLWRISVPPSKSAQVVMNITKIFSGEAIYDWGGGLVWLQIKGPFKDGPKILRKTVQEVGGHATLFGAPEQIRRKTPIFHPQKEPLRGLTERIKTGFDPLHILNPSKMYEGI